MFNPRPLQGVSPALTLRSNTERSRPHSSVVDAYSSPQPSKFCENGRAYITDPSTNQPVCLCRLDNHSAHSLQAHPALRGLRGLPGRPGFGDLHNYHTQLSAIAPLTDHTNGLLPAQLTYHPYSAMYAGIDVTAGPIRKVATRETTGPLKVWLSEHKKNPYPTKAEKIMLAIITRMTLTQVSTWFANARRRLKKDNRMSPGGGEDDAGGLDSDREGDLDSETGVNMGLQVKTSRRPDAPLSSEGEVEPDSFSDISDDDDNDVFRSDPRHRSRTPSSNNRVPVITSTPEAAIFATSPHTPPRDTLSASPYTAPFETSPSAVALKLFAAVPDSAPSRVFATSPEKLGQCPKLSESQSSEIPKPKPKIWSISQILDS